MLSRAARNRAKRTILSLHKLGLRLGIVLLPNHYYTGVADLNELARTRQLWAHKSLMRGIECDLDGQASRLREFCAPFEPEYRGNGVYREAVRSGSGPGFGYIEAQALHGVVRRLNPARIVEVGSGVSTRCMLAACARNREETGRGCQITSIEPFPRPWLRSASVELIQKPVQAVGPALFEGLGPGSLVFIDSSHTVRTGGDVNYLVLEVMPRLSRGVIVHFHDVYLPYDYPRDALATLSQSQETALLHAYLIGNHAVRILFSLGQLHYAQPEVLREVFPEYRPQRERDGLHDEGRDPFEEVPEHFPSSIYLEIIGKV